MRLVSLFALFITIFSTGCQKNKGLSGYTKDLDFSFGDTLEIGKPIKFISNEPVNSVFLWKFGTGDQSSADSPAYTYSIAGAFTVLLKINDTGTGVSKVVNISIGTDRLARIVSGRSWNGSINIHTGSTDSTYNFSDSSFSCCTIATDTSLFGYSHEYKYIRPFSNNPFNKSVSFGVGLVGNPDETWSSIYYNYQKDSVDLIIHSGTSASYVQYDFQSTH